MADHALTAAAFALVLAIVCGIGIDRRFDTGAGGEHTAMLARSSP